MYNLERQPLLRTTLCVALTVMIFACDTNGTAEEPMLNYPVTFQLTDYVSDNPIYYAVVGQEYELVDAVSTDFDTYLQEEVFDRLLPEAQQEYDFRGIRLESETACAIAYFDPFTGESGWTPPNLLYAWDETEFMVFDSTRRFVINLTYSETDQRLELCDWAFVYTWQTERGYQDFNGPDFPTCKQLNELDDSDPVHAYLLHAGSRGFDTLCVIPLTRQYYQE